MKFLVSIFVLCGLPGLLFSQAMPKLNSDLSHGPCGKALTQGAVCDAANKFALDFIKENNLKAITVVHDVQTGGLIAYAASDPAELDVTTALLPLSLTKILIAASWWDNQLPEETFVSSLPENAVLKRVTMAEMFFNSSDTAGRNSAIELRRRLGTKNALEDFEKYGFGRKTDSDRDEKFWSEIPSVWRSRLTPKPSYFLADEKTSENDWGYDLSIGEAHFQTTALHISRLMQAIGNGGIQIAPFALAAQLDASANRKQVSLQAVNTRRLVKESTAKKLQAAMLDTVRQGTATSILPILASTGWTIGGKTGSMIRPIGGPADTADGWFAGLVFDPPGRARFAVATFVRHGGLGGGNAARISANLAKFLIEGKVTKTR